MNNPEEKKEKIVTRLERYYNTENSMLTEIGVDESGRGPMFGRLYVAAVVLPTSSQDSPLWTADIKDSKKFTKTTNKTPNKTDKIHKVAEIIKQNAVAWTVEFIESDEIDRINIREAVMKGMSKCISNIMEQMSLTEETAFLLIDGTDFSPYMMPINNSEHIRYVPHITIPQGDGKYMAIAAASILAKVARDDYILHLCEMYPALIDKYQLQTNMGYGTKVHMAGIAKYGNSPWHRKTFGLCKSVHDWDTNETTNTTQTTQNLP